MAMVRRGWMGWDDGVYIVCVVCMIMRIDDTHAGIGDTVGVADQKISICWLFMPAFFQLGLPRNNHIEKLILVRNLGRNFSTKSCFCIFSFASRKIL